MGCPSLGAMHDDNIGEFPPLNGAEKVSTNFQTRIIIRRESLTDDLRTSSIGMTRKLFFVGDAVSADEELVDLVCARESSPTGISIESIAVVWRNSWSNCCSASSIEVCIVEANLLGMRIGDGALGSTHK